MCISQTKSAATFLIAEKRKPPKKLKHALWHIRIHEGGSIHHCLKTCTNYCTQEQQQHWHLNKQSNTQKRHNRWSQSVAQALGATTTLAPQQYTTHRRNRLVTKCRTSTGSNNNTGTSINSQTHTKEAQQVVTKCSTSTGSKLAPQQYTTHRRNRLVTKCAKAVQVTKKAYT